jgi:hypothetical protein
MMDDETIALTVLKLGDRLVGHPLPVRALVEHASEAATFSGIQRVG